MAIIKGRVIKLPDKIDTDIIIPTQYLTFETVAEMAAYAFSPLRPEIPKIVRKGDILVGGLDFGCGSSREQAPEIIKALGFAAVVAKSFARIFYRNAINNGLLVIECPELHDLVQEGDQITLDTASCFIELPGGTRLSFGRIPDKLQELIACGGLVSYYQRKNEVTGDRPRGIGSNH